MGDRHPSQAAPHGPSTGGYRTNVRGFRDFHKRTPTAVARPSRTRARVSEGVMADQDCTWKAEANLMNRGAGLIHRGSGAW